VLDTTSHQRNAHRELQRKRRKEPDESVDTVPPRWHKDSLPLSSHLLCCNGPKKHKLIFHLHFLSASQPRGTGTEDPSEVSFHIALAFGLGTLQKKTEQNLSPCKRRACVQVCVRECVTVQNCVSTTCRRDSALNTTSRGCFHLWFRYVLRALFPKNFSLNSLLQQLEMTRKVIAGFICHQSEIAFM